MTTPEHCNKDAICELTKSSVGAWNNFDEQKRKIINTDFCFVFIDEIVGCCIKESKDYYRYCVYIRTDGCSMLAYRFKNLDDAADAKNKLLKELE